ncbi:MAG: hypothetical protein K5798_03690 [Nitrosopumilus sp.]|uniref:hypothetical protein n=1 Tax=Nitrosopumilus sp. TaxID=2024843 RepID=UPI00242A3C43|nr:hypothetical protein [Nitrosopumilus sp.]MCV0366355.1 hypothetical protein [Nitrosopumilus sp.]
MKIRFLMIFAFVMIMPITESFAEPIEIKFGETVQYEDLNLSFYDIEDSRCPLDVTCIWEGKVTAMVHTSNQTHKIGAGFEIGYLLTHITPYTITLLDVKPHPISTEKPDYVAILDISKTEKNIDVNYVDFRDASGEIIEVGCGIGLRASPDDSLGTDILLFFKCNPSLTLILVLIVGVMVGVIFVVWRKRK